MTVTKLLPGIWSFEEDHVRSFLVVGESRALLIDTGWGVYDPNTEVAKLTDLPVDLVVTHSDMDHVGGCARWQHRCFVCRHELESFALHTGGADCTPIGEGHRFELGSRTLEVLEIPGHTPGSIALLDREHGILFSGDTVSLITVYMFGPGRDLPAYIRSLTKLEALGDTVRLCLPNHGTCPIPPGDLCRQLRELTDFVLSGGETDEREHMEFPGFSRDVRVFRRGDVSLYAL